MIGDIFAVIGLLFYISVGLIIIRVVAHPMALWIAFLWPILVLIVLIIFCICFAVDLFKEAFNGRKSSTD